MSKVATPSLLEAWRGLAATDCQESVHVLRKEADKVMAENKSLNPGINCCARCASDDAETVCNTCNLVRYCGSEHMSEDKEVHEKVCAVLKKLGSVDNVEVEDAEIEAVIASLVDNVDTTLSGWTDLVQGGADSSTVVVENGSEADHEAGSGADVEVEGGNKEYVLAASASSYLSTPLTLAYCLQTSGPLKALVAGCVKSEEALVVTVVAAAEAEVKQLNAWKALERAAGCKVVLQLVGPDVPEDMHLKVHDIGSRTKITSFKGVYEDLADGLLKADDGLPTELTHLPHLFLGPNMSLTHPEYQWDAALEAMQRIAAKAASARTGAPLDPIPEATASKAPPASNGATAPAAAKVEGMLLLSTAATQAESFEEAAVLSDKGWRTLVETKRNPFLSLEVLHSSALANDMYRKSSWLQLHSTPTARPGKRKSWGEVVTTWVSSIVDFVSPAKRARPSNTPAPSPAQP